MEASEVRGSVELSLRLLAGSSCLKSTVPTAAQRTAHARLGTTRPCTCKYTTIMSRLGAMAVRETRS